MTTKNILLGLFLAFTTCAIAQRENGEKQDNGDVVFSDGTVINFKMLENDPNVRVDWAVLGSFKPTYFEEYLAMTLGLQANLNLKNYAELHAETRGGLHIDFNMFDDDGAAYNSLKKQYQHHKLEASIKFYNNESVKTTSIVLDESTSGYTTTAYMVVGDLKYKSSYGLVAGIDYTQRRVKSDRIEGTVVDTNVNGLDNFYYKPLTLYQTNLRLGLDITMITSSLVEIDGFSRVDYQHGRLYAVVLLPLSQRMDVAKYSDNILGNNTAELVDESQYKAPGFTNIGYLIGGELLNEFDRGGGYFGLSLEVGILPGIAHDNVFDNFTASLGIQIGFGSNLNKSWEKK